ncbi:MAG: carbohydrate ABC transporter permease [Sphaerochaeta sp.]|jgi:raffinose/stachyose/melibiose transport system permease protein
MKERNKHVIMYIVLIFFAVIWISPIFVAIEKSLQVTGFKSYISVLTYDKINYFKVVLNSLIIAVSTASVVVLISSLAAYAFSKMKFIGSKVLYLLFLGCLAVPAAAVTMPLFSTIKNLGLIDTRLGVILPLIAFNTPMMLLMITNYFNSIPNSLLESAKIDGANSFIVYRIIIMPLAIPIIANVLVLTFIYSWNEYLMPLLVVRTEGKYTVTLAAQYFMSTTFQSPADVAKIYAAMLLLTLPSIVVYMFSQKYLQAGLTAGAIKE